MKKIVTLAAAIALAVGTASAQVPPSASSTQPTAKHAGFMGALKGGAIGCLAGGLLGKLTHHSLLKSCAIGGAAGAVIGGVRAYRNQVKEANAIAEQARAAGATADVQTRTVDAKDADGSTEQTQALHTLHLALSPTQVADHSADTQALLARAGALAKSSSDPVMLRITGPKADRSWIAGQLQQATGDSANVSYDETYAASPAVDVVIQPRVASTAGGANGAS